MRKNHMMIATLAMLSVVGSAQYARAQQTGTNQNAKEWGDCLKTHSSQNVS